jgi:hypothetical protein
VQGLEGFVAGISEDDDGHRWTYAIYFYALQRVYMFDGSDLETTGRFDQEEANRVRPTIRVAVDPVTCEGRIISDEGLVAGS